jgi:hypothetical protein
MKRKTWIVAAVGIFIMISANMVYADAGLWSYGTPLIRSDAPELTGSEAMVTVTGTVKKVEPMKLQKDGVQMRITSDDGKYVVYLGPKWFIDNQKIKFAAGDKVEVRGKKVGGAIIASEVSKGDWTMRIRNEEDGQAVWQCCFPYKERKD